MAIPPFGTPPTPDATPTKKGKIKLAGSLGGTADSPTVATNANLTGPITSTGNATTIASQTGTGTKFVVDTSPTIATPSFTGNVSMASNTFINGGGNLIVGGNGTNTLIRPATNGNQVQIQNFNGSDNLKLQDGGGLTIETPSNTSKSVLTTDGTQTLTNKRVTLRIGTTASSATPTINTDNVDQYNITALAAAITSFTTNLSGTPTDGQKLTIRILDNGTARAIAWGASFASRGGTLPTTTVLSKYLYVGFIYNGVALVWDCVAVSQEV